MRAFDRRCWIWAFDGYCSLRLTTACGGDLPSQSPLRRRPRAQAGGGRPLITTVVVAAVRLHREGLAVLLTQDGRVRVAATAGQSAEAVSALASEPCSITL